MILKCICIHADQDRRYGAGFRVHNERKGGGVFRCTVCQKEQNGPNKHVPQQAEKKS